MGDRIEWNRPVKGIQLASKGCKCTDFKGRLKWADPTDCGLTCHDLAGAQHGSLIEHGLTYPEQEELQCRYFCLGFCPASAVLEGSFCKQEAYTSNKRAKCRETPYGDLTITTVRAPENG